MNNQEKKTYEVSRIPPEAGIGFDIKAVSLTDRETRGTRLILCAVTRSVKSHLQIHPLRVTSDGFLEIPLRSEGTCVGETVQMNPPKQESE